MTKKASITKQIFLIIETILVIFALFVLMGLVLDRDSLSNISEDFASASPLSQAINYSAYSLGILLSLSQYKRVLKFAFKDTFLWIFIATAFLSSLWSENYVLTLGRSITLFAVALLGTYLATRYSLAGIFKLLCIALALIAVSSLFFAILNPKDAILFDNARSAMRWQGILAHPTSFGRTMALSTVMWLLYVINKRRYRPVSIGIFILSAILTLLSHAIGSYLAVFLVSGLITILVTSRGRYRSLALIFWLVLIPLVIIGFMSNYGLLLSSFNRDETLTGRIPLWAGVIEMIAQKPWLGYGYGAFWTGNGPSAIVWLIAGWKAPHAHNGLLDIWLQVGLLGLVPFLISLFRNISKAVAELRHKNKIESLFPITLLTCLIAINIVESGLTSGNILWALYVFLSTYLSMRNSVTAKLQQKRVEIQKV